MLTNGGIDMPIRPDIISSPRPQIKMVAESTIMQRLVRRIGLVANVPYMPVLIDGETGTGKELVAREIHRLSFNDYAPFIAFNCAAFAESMIEAQLFGHEAGSFTGAAGKRVGLLEDGDRGSVFLDEISEIPLQLQAKLLRFLAEGEVIRLGGRTVKIVTRVIAATNRDLKREVEQGKFREDLYYRLAVFPISVPPLREHKSDIPALASHCIGRFNARYGTDLSTVISPDIAAELGKRNWAGNVRDLMNTVERAIVFRLGQGSGLLELSDFEFADPEPEVKLTIGGNYTVYEIEKAHITRVLERCKYNKREAADILGIARVTLYHKIRNMNISVSGKHSEDEGTKRSERDLIRATLEKCHWHRAEAAQMLGIKYRTFLKKISKYKLDG